MILKTAVEYHEIFLMSMDAFAHTDSYYAATARGATELPALDGELRCDICVIGGGFTGVSAALHLAERGYDVVLLEANRIGWGASGRNGGQINSGLSKRQDFVEKLVGIEAARRLWALCEEAKSIVRARIERHRIPCELKSGGLNAGCKPADASSNARYAEKLRNEYDYEQIRAVSREEMAEMLGTDIYHGGSLDTGAGHLHPLNYVLGLARAALEAGARIFEGSTVNAYERASPCKVRTARGAVVADFVVLACNAYLQSLEPRVAGRIMPINNFILATEPLGDERARSLIRDDVAVSDSKFIVNYYRLSGDKRLLFGGGENYTRRFPNDIKSFVRKHMLRVYPQLEDARIDYGWGGTLAITMKRTPDFGRLEPNIFFAHGYSGQGVALTSLAGKLIAEAVAGTAERFDVFARIPTPTFPGGTWLRWPGLVAGMFYYGLRDKL